MAREPTFHRFEHARDMIDALADRILASVWAGVRARNRASLVVSGGRTPGDLYDLLSTCEAPWAETTIALADERWVPPTSEQSNERLVRSRLLVGEVACASFVPFKTDAAHARDGEDEVHRRLLAMTRPFDATLLGMGDDGHTASLIPGSEGLARALDLSDPMLARGIVPPPKSGMGERMTMTLRGLLDSRAICLMIRGEAKLSAYREAMMGDDVPAMPVRGVLHQTQVPVDIFWAP